MNSSWFRISLFFFFLVALIGTLLRSVAFIPISLEYVYLVHAHSHTAFQGWVYLAMMLILCRVFLHKDQIAKGRYALQFKLTVLIVIGVLISFSLQGYALYSILFSTLFQLLNYWFIFRFLRDTSGTDKNSGDQLPMLFVKTGLWLGLFSTLLPFAVGIVSAKGLAGSEAYRSLVYTFLHFQYNGWFLFVVLGLFFKLLSISHSTYNNKFANIFYWLMTIAIIPSTALSLLGMNFAEEINPVAIVSALLIGLALLAFARALPFGFLKSLQTKSRWFQIYLFVFLFSFCTKLILQFLSVFSFFKDYAFYNKSIILSYLHLSLIGVISFFLLSYFLELKWLEVNKLVKAGSILLIAGFFITEFLLALTGTGLYYSQITLILGSAAMTLGILLLLISKVSHLRTS